MDRDKEILEDYQSGMRLKEMGQKYGLSSRYVIQVVKRICQKMQVPFKKRRSNIPGYRKEYIPTPEEIKRGCLSIQSEWTEEERESRSCYAHFSDKIYKVRK